MKQFKNIIKSAIRSIVRNRMRSLLTSLGIIIGVCAVIVMSAFTQGAQYQIKEQINSLGTNMLMIMPGSSFSGGIHQGSGSFNRFTLDDVDDIRDEATYLSTISPIVRSQGQVVGNGNNWSTEITGVTTDYFEIKDWGVQYGETFTDKDVSAKRKVALLGKTVADELFPDQDPTGEKIRIGNIPFTVIGVLEEKGQTGMGRDQDDIILAPATTVLYRLKGGRYIDMINASATTENDMDKAEEEIRTVLRQSHRLAEGEADDFTIRSQTEIVETVENATNTLTLLLGAIASVSLVVGGIGIMNIMLVSVTERTREIGIRLSVGARSGDVLSQFLFEAIVLSLSGGSIGILLAAAMSAGINQFTSYTSVIQPYIVAIAFAFSGVVGIFFGYYPARKAAALNPIDALRFE
ncbi:MAG: ABC transporter permease [Candidatus Zixiibacteriota bacterium]